MGIQLYYYHIYGYTTISTPTISASLSPPHKSIFMYSSLEVPLQTHLKENKQSNSYHILHSLYVL